MAAITINVSGMDAIRKQLAEVEVSPALQRATSEAVRQSVGAQGDAAMKASALGAGWDYLKQAHDRRMSEYSRRIATESDLAALGVKRLSSAI